MFTSAALQAQLGLRASSSGSLRIRSNNVLRCRLQSIQSRRSYRCLVAATAEPDVTEEQKSEDAPKRRQRRRRSNKPTHGPERSIKLEDLEKDKSYEAHVVGLTDFGAFVNIGAMTDGLLHISQISQDFVSNVADVVSIGDVLEVRIINVDLDKQKFSVTALDKETFDNRQARREEVAAAAAEGRQPPPRQARAKTQRRQSRPSCPFAVNQMVTGTVKSVVPFGAFITLDDDFDAMLHTSHMKLPEDVTDHIGIFQEGQEVEVRVIHVGGRGNERIRVSQLTEEEAEQLEKVMTRGFASVEEVPHGSGPMAFALAKAGVTPEMFPETPLPASDKLDKTEDNTQVTSSPKAKEEVATKKPVEEDKKPAGSAISASLVKELRDASGAGMMDCKKALGETGGDIEAAKEWLRKKGLASADKKAGRVASEGSVQSYIHAGSRLGVLVEINCETDFVARGEKFKELVNDMAMQIAACPQVSVVSTSDVPSEVLERERAIEMEKEDLKSKPEEIREKIVQGRLDKIAKELALMEQPFIKDTSKTVEDVIKESIATIGENIQIRRFVRYNLGEGIEQEDKGDFAAEVEAQQAAMAAKAAEKKQEDKEEKKEEKPATQTIAISASLVKELRDASGAGMMDCKKALGETGGDIEAAKEWLRKKGLASADKKAGRVASEGAIGAYIHAGSRLGVLVEVNCETDFVARGEKFKELVNDMAMQIAACPDVTVVSTADVPAEVLERERAIEMEKEDLKNKPEEIRGKIVQGRLDKIAKELALMEQPFIKDTSKTVAEHIKEQIAGIGENIGVRRFEKYNLGEGIEKKEVDFAAEVAEQTGGRI